MIVHVAVPHADDEIKIKTMMALFGIIVSTPGVQCNLTTIGGCYIEHTRTLFAKNALKAGADFLLFVDTDMIFEPDALQRLMAHALAGKADIVGVNYHTRSQEDSVSTVKLPGTGGPLGETSGGPKDRPENGRIEWQVPTEPFEAYALGTGLMLVNMRVFREMPFPWFAQQFNQETGDIELGDDTYFCRKARQYGFKVLCDPTIPVGHLGQYEY